MVELGGSVEEIALAKKGFRTAMITAIIFLVGLQIGWLIVTSQAAEREVNSLDKPFHSNHLFEVPNIIGMSQPMPVTFTCENVISEGNSSTEMWWKLYDSNDAVIEYWNGPTGGDCGGFDRQLATGQYTLVTMPDSGADFHQTLELRVWGGVAFEGHIVALLVAILLGGVGVWRAKKKINTLSTPLPLHKIVQKGVWEKVHSDMEDKDRIHAEIEETGFGNFTNQPMSQTATGKTVPDIEDGPKIAGEFDYTDEIEAEALVDEMEEFGFATMKGLRGPVERDERIKKVSDIYDLMDD